MIPPAEGEWGAGAPPSTGMGQSFAEAEAVTNLHFFVAMLKTVCFRRKSAFLPRCSMQAVFLAAKVSVRLSVRPSVRHRREL